MEKSTPLRKLISENSLSHEELERRKLGALRLRERLLPIPFYQEQDQKDGMEYWDRLYASQVNS